MERMGRKRRRRCMNNKGFSLVELIIVIAIMAILIGVMAPQLMKYVDRTRVSSDKQLGDTVRTAIMTALMDPEVTDAPTAISFTELAEIDNLLTSNQKFVKTVLEILNTTTVAEAENKLQSKLFKDTKIRVEIASNKVTVTLVAKAPGTAADNITIG